MPIFNEDTRNQLIDLIGEIPEKVNILFFSRETKCRSCKDTQQYITEFSELHQNIELAIYDQEKDSEQIDKFGIERFPATVILDKAGIDRGIKFYGIPSGYEIHSLITSVKEAGGISKPNTQEIENRIKNIINKIHIKVFVTPQCPHCPSAVITGHNLAFLNENIVCDMIESTTFSELSQKYGVRGVPKIIINETHEFTGSQPISKFLDVIESV